MKTEDAPDIREIISDIVDRLDMNHIDVSRIVCMRSRGTSTNAIARIWSLPKIWQKALDVKAHYIIEAVSENFDKLDDEEKRRTMLHELMHIPRTFSGAVLSHKYCHFDGKGGHEIKKINKKTVDKLFKEYQRAHRPTR